MENIANITEPYIAESYIAEKFSLLTIVSVSLLSLGLAELILSASNTCSGSMVRVRLRAAAPPLPGRVKVLELPADNPNKQM